VQLTGLKTPLFAILVKLTRPVRVAIVELEVTVAVQEADAPVGTLA